MDEKWIKLAKLAADCCGDGTCCRNDYHELAASLLRKEGYVHPRVTYPERYDPDAWYLPD